MQFAVPTNGEFFKKEFQSLLICMCVSLCVHCVCVCQKQALNPLDLNLQVVVSLQAWVLVLCESSMHS